MDPSKEQSIDQIISGDVFKALSETVRLEIIRYLVLNGESDISSIAGNFTQDRSVISRHLQSMEQAGLLLKRKESRHIFYRFDGRSFLNKLDDLSDTIRTMIEENCDDCFT